MNTVLGLSKPPLVHSVSYGNDEVQQTSSAYMTAVDQQFQQAAAIGLSILFASGKVNSWRL
jgi:subtilase family serine protease